MQKVLFIGFVVATALFAGYKAVVSISSNNAQVEDWSQKYPQGTVIEGHWPKEILAIEQLIYDAAILAEIDPELYAALIMKESYYWGKNCPDGPVTMSCKSVSGAIGPAQIQPQFHYAPGEDLTNLRLNVFKGATILADNINQTGSVKLGLQMYNCGNEYRPCAPYAESVFIYLKNSGNG